MATQNKNYPFKDDEIIQLCDEHPTPFHLYDEDEIRGQIRKLNQAFSWSPEGFMNYFAVKATPNPAILNILVEEGCGMDCSSLAELHLAQAAGCTSHKVMFTSNNTPLKEYTKALDMNAIINVDDISHLEFFEEQFQRLPQYLSFRYNPGPSRTGNIIIGNPEDAKFGLTRDQLFDAYNAAKNKGVRMFGLHTMVVSNSLDATELIETARMMFQLVIEIQQKCGVSISMVNLGGGVGVAYKPTDKPIDLNTVSEGVEIEFKKMREEVKHPVKIVMECGRFITGPGGYLVTRVQHQKNTYKNYLGVDASMANLMRPGLYGAYHHISVVPVPNNKVPHNLPTRRSIIDAENLYNPTGISKLKRPGVYDVVGGLCENNDKLAIDRELGMVRIGDLLVIHDTGAHGHSMGFNYNGKLRSAELLRQSLEEPVLGNRIVEIRRAETLDDLFTTLQTQKSLSGLAKPCERVQRCTSRNSYLCPLVLAATGLLTFAAVGYRLSSKGKNIS
eukprot:GHVN01050857.1.p1 GENE.GHVN01050857.1~~GHVN01050857.1.p1  ORF type:complete len:502 (-),score=48.65 GHVN01050857.1:1452-2957(-)